MSESKHIKCEDPYDPKRCQTNDKYGQCEYLSAPDSKYCPKHMGCGGQQGEKARFRMYQVESWKNRLEDKIDHEGRKTLTEEVAIARLTLEGILKQCSNDNDLLLYSNKISDLVVKIDKLVNSCHKLEKQSGVLIDKAAVLNIVGFILQILSEEIKDTDVMDRISNRILSHIAEMKPGVEDA
jgi:hypothetical protein